MNRNVEWDAWIAKAKAVDIGSVIAARGGLGLKKHKNEFIGPCPQCGGEDRFSVCIQHGKQVFNCRGCGAKGDVIDLVRFIDGVDFEPAVETLAGAKPNGHDKLGKAIAEYSYMDEAGALLFQVVRFDPKTFRQRRPDGHGHWTWNVTGARMVPYRLPELIEASANEHPVVVVEGERDVHTAERLGLVATTNPQGAGKWRDEYDQYFTNADVIIVPDRDLAGMAHAQTIAAHLQKVAKRVRMVNLNAKDLTLWNQRGGTREQFDKLVEDSPGPKEQSAKEPRFKLRPFASLDFKCKSTYLVKHLIPQEGLVVIWGPPKCGKSFWTFDLTMHIAMGRLDYRGRRIKQTPIVYCAFEGEGGFVNRKEAFLRRNEVLGYVPFFIVGTHMDMAKEHRLLINDIRAQIGEILPGVVVLDTLNRSLGGSENKDEDMAAYVKAADAIREAFHCVVIIIHHCGIDGSRPRGHSSLTGAADAQLAVKKDATRNIVVTVEYMKDGQEGDIIVSRLERVPLGLDEDGDEISSCVIVPLDDAAAVARQAVNLTKNQQTLLSILGTAGKAGMQNDDWFAAAKELGIATRRKADFYDNRRALEEKHIVVKQNDGRWYVLEIAAQPIGAAA